MNQIVGRANVLFITFDTLRYDVAQQEYAGGGTPNLAKLLPCGWEKRHAPGSFTFASHSAFFAGFLPTPAQPGVHQRLFALNFAGSESCGPGTCLFDAPDIVSGFAGRGYRTICIGGTGFFKKQNPLSCVLPNLFQESYWQPEFGVTDADSTRNQIAFALSLLDTANAQEKQQDHQQGNQQGNQQKKKQHNPQQNLFLFMNLSALHQPNCHYLPGASSDSVATHAAALRYIDTQLPPLFHALNQRGDTLVILCSDHGTTYGEDGYTGHRIGHEQVWTVPYADFFLAQGCLP